MVLEKNLITLKERYPELVDDLKEVDSQMNNFEIIEAKNKSKTAIIKIDNKPIFLHSKYNPEKEADRIVSQINLEKLNRVIVLGFGLGYHILNLFKKIKDKDIKLFIVETNLSLFKKALEYQDFTHIFSSPKFNLLLKDKISKKEFNHFIHSSIDEIFNHLGSLILPNMIKCNQEQYKDIIKELNFLLKKSIINKNTINLFGSRWENNLVRNMDLLVNNPGFEILKQIQVNNKPAIIVSAGPSLNKNIELLKEAEEKSLLIAVDAVLRPLLSKGITPHIVTAVDGNKGILKYFENLDPTKLKDIILVASPQLDRKVLEDWPGPLIIIPGNGLADDYLHWIEKNSNYKGRISCGGSVAHAAFDIAYKLEADPIIFVGQDLAFTDGITHVIGSEYSRTVEEDMEILAEKKGYLKIKDINGDEIWTRNDFYFYLEWFNKFIKHLKNEGVETLFIDATEGGARIEGTELMTLREVIDGYCREDIFIKDEMINAISSYNHMWNHDIILELDKIIEDIFTIKELATEGLLLIDKLVGGISNEKVNRFSLKINKVNDKIKSLSSNIMFFESSMYGIYTQDDLLYKKNLNNINKLVDFYNRLISGSQGAIEILRNNLKRFSIEEEKRWK